jgi:glutamate-5-semialdehyde dehydrogenase
MGRGRIGLDVREHVLEKARRAKGASRKLANLSSKIRNDALMAMADAILDKMDRIIEANEEDVKNAKASGRSSAFIDRLTLTESRIKAMADGIREVAALPDPVGEVIRMWRRPNGLLIGQVRVPLGVIAFIYESRPNVTADGIALAVKSANSIILRGGSEAIRSNMAIWKLMAEVGYSSGLPNGCIEMVEVTDRAAVLELGKLEGLVDVIIPRGGPELIRTVVSNSTIPVIRHEAGNCHVYVDEYADLPMAVKICYNAKVQRPGVCNAMETMLVHEAIAERFLPMMIEEFEKAGVEIRGCERTREIVPHVKPATEEDWWTEYLDLILAVKVVKSIDEAIDHINHYGSGHSDAIVTENYTNAQRFLWEVDSAAVYVNASTRFTDGNQFGLGAEAGISTQKLHARGPVGAAELTTTKYIIYGTGQIRE